jgi:hypothetical protein
MTQATIVKRRKPITELRPRRHPVAECSRCHQHVPIAGRGLCDACYYVCRKNGTLIDYPTVYARWKDEELIQEYELLRSAGNTIETIAGRLGFRNATVFRTRLRAAGVQVPPGRRGRPMGRSR